jgi:hypothetical protein
MAVEVSKTTVTILLVLTILVSLVSTWVMMESVSQPSQAAVLPDNNVVQGQVSLRIVSPEEAGHKTTGMVSLQIGGEKNG